MQVLREARFGIFVGIYLVLVLHLMIPDGWIGYKARLGMLHFMMASLLSLLIWSMLDCGSQRDTGFGIFMRICHILLHLYIPDQWHGFWAWNWTSIMMDSLLSLLIWSMLDFVALKLVQET